jgi:hypothetical protein
MSGQEQNGKLNCPDFEVQLSDYLDGVLSVEAKQLFEGHSAGCGPCRELLEDAKSALAFLERVPDVDVPPDLVTRIVYNTPAGKIRQPFERQGLFGKAFSQWLMPALQPRFAMGMAMTILSFAMLGRCTGVQVTQIKAAELNPVKVWQNVEDRVIRTKDRATKYYENLRLVYEIRSRLNELEEQREIAAQSEVQDKSRTQSTSGAPEGNRQQNEAPGDRTQSDHQPPVPTNEPGGTRR